MDLDLNGKVVFLTGANGGIGFETAKILYEEGARLILHYNSNNDNIVKLFDKINSDGNEALMVKADLRHESEVIAAFDQVQQRFGKIDALVNNAGFWPPNDIRIADMDVDQWENTINTNLKSMFLVCKHFLKNLRKFKSDERSIVLISSTAGIFGEAGHLDYASSKSGIFGMMLSLKNEITKVARYGRVNTVSPGWVLTPMAKDSLQDLDNVAKVMQTIALRKIGRPVDIANCVAFLLSHKVAGHISGQNIAVTGGMEGRVLWKSEELDLNNF